MSIPGFNEHGWLPRGVYDCTLEEAAVRFGGFQGSDRRPRLWRQFVEFMHEAKASGLVEAVLVDGSFVTDKSAPNDIDIVVIVFAHHDFTTELLPSQYNLLVQNQVRKRFGFDIVVVRSGSEDLEQAITFFQQVRQQPGLKKGLLRIVL